MWEGNKPGFGEIAVAYAAGEDVVLDKQLVQYECKVNQAHVKMLLTQGIISKAVAEKLLQGLKEIAKLDKQGKFVMRPELEDVHSNVEQWLIEKLGIEVGGYLRLGIARNDQVYTDTRLWIKEHVLNIADELATLIDGVLVVAKKHTEMVMPGYTHMWISQPITYGHWLAAKAYHFFDDLRNILSIFDTVNQCPLGIFEMAGTHLPIDRKLTAKLLGFAGVTPNSLYTANQRGEIELQLMQTLQMLALHIQRTMNEVIIFSTHEFGLVQINDAYATGGTAQPNLKNPDTLEVVRANMAKFNGYVVMLYSIMDSLPSGFNRDTQQTKSILFEGVKLMEKTLPVVAGILTSLTANEKRMEEVANWNFSVAPDVAVQLAIKGGVSFREAYKVVKALIAEGYVKKSFVELTPKLVATVSGEKLGKRIKVTAADLAQVATARACVGAHNSEGGPAPGQVKKQIADLQSKSVRVKKDVMGKRSGLFLALSGLQKEVHTIIST